MEARHDFPRVDLFKYQHVIILQVMKKRAKRRLCLTGRLHYYALQI